MRTRKYLCLIVGTIVLAGLACQTLFPTPIGKIRNDIRDYDGKVVNIQGTVSDVFSLVFVKYFTVKDKTGEIAVVTSKALPQKGDKVKVTGTVKQAFSIGAQSLTVIVEQEARPARGTK
jgi:hypothetical protein